jgi:hypothetical protein
MPNIYKFKGFIKGVSYKANLTAPLVTYDLGEFDINVAKPCGLIGAGEHRIGYSKWVSPKRTRTYPFERIYNTYNAVRSLTVIPIIKDEGRDGDLDKIQYSTISWMNLLNVYIVLAYYETAEKSRRASQAERHKLTRQKLNNEFVKAQIEEIINYKQSALHWNKNLLAERFVDIFRKALNSYQAISRKTKVKVHPHTSLQNYLEQIVGDFGTFERQSLKSSERASARELVTSHKFEHLVEGDKGQFFIENYLGGGYHLTADEIVPSGKGYVIQESKNSSKGFLPSLCDIRDGLFKLILFSNLDRLLLDGKQVKFSCRLKLTGGRVIGSIRFPCIQSELKQFLEVNKGRYSRANAETLEKLRVEAEQNHGLEIYVTHNA